MSDPGSDKDTLLTHPHQQGPETVCMFRSQGIQPGSPTLPNRNSFWALKHWYTVPAHVWDLRCSPMLGRAVPETSQKP